MKKLSAYHDPDSPLAAIILEFAQGAMFDEASGEQGSVQLLVSKQVLVPKSAGLDEIIFDENRLKEKTKISLPEQDLLSQNILFDIYEYLKNVEGIVLWGGPIWGAMVRNSHT